MKPVVYDLFDSFNRRQLSSHLTLANALKAKIKHAKKWARCNGGDAYVHYLIIRSDDTYITRDQMIEAEIAAGIY